MLHASPGCEQCVALHVLCIILLQFVGTRTFLTSTCCFLACSQQVVDFVRPRLEKGCPPHEVASELLNACLANDPKEARGIGCDNMTAAVSGADMCDESAGRVGRAVLVLLSCVVTASCCMRLACRCSMSIKHVDQATMQSLLHV
jgi:hypothetical protein